jgi:rare lipoprotein A
MLVESDTRLQCRDTLRLGQADRGHRMNQCLPMARPPGYHSGMPPVRWAFSFVMLCACGCAREPAGHSSQPALEPVAPSRPSTGCSDEDLRQPARQVLNGLATYYADSLAGQRTASGERYDPKRLSAAHRSLPFGTRLRVTRIDVVPERVSCVTVNDRGPYAGRRRVVDVSRRAAEQLGMIGAGVIRVRVDVL